MGKIASAFETAMANAAKEQDPAAKRRILEKVTSENPVT